MVRPSLTTSNPWRGAAAALALLLAALPTPGRAGEPVAEEATADLPGAAEAGSPAQPPAALPRPRLTLDFTTQAVVTGGLLLFTGVTQYYDYKLVAKECRWCTPGRFDVWVRNQLLWRDTKSADLASGALMVALPVGAAVAMIFTGRANGATGREVAEDLLVMAEATATATAMMQVAKYPTARVRPYAWAAGGFTSPGSKMSFWAGHSSSAFAIAASATQISRMRGRPSWKWIAVTTFTGAAAISYMRIASDRHWGTDVLVGTAVGTTVGLVMPLLVFHPAGERKPAVTLVPAAGGLALIF